MIVKNEAQEKAIKTINGPVIMISCPGSGKTSTLMRRTKNIIDNGVNPKKILIVTFTKSAAIDMNDRYKAMFNENPGITFATIHSLCLNILKAEGKFNYNDVLTEDVKWEFFYKATMGINEIEDRTEFIKSLLTDITVVKNNYIDLNKFNPTSCKISSFKKLFNAYEKFKEEQGKIDFDDMLIECEQLFINNKDILEKWQNRFDYIQVDEYQDTNLIQKNILYMLADNNKNICVVGDDDQSIYAFRGADSSIMMGFADDMENCEKIFMSTNYRSAQKIIDISDKCIKHNKTRFEKDFISFRGEEKGIDGNVEINEYTNSVQEIRDIINKIKNIKDIPYKEIAILFRNNSQSQDVITELLKKEIPFSSTEKIKTAYDSSTFKIIKSYIELSQGINEKKNMLTVLNKPNRFLDPKAFYNTKFKQEDMLKSLNYLTGEQAWKYDKAEMSIYTWMTYLGPGKIKDDTKTKDLFNIFENKLNYIEYLINVAEYRNQDTKEIVEDWEKIKRDALRHETIKKWFDYIEDFKKKMAEKERTNNENGIKISTMHKSKGMEWDTVFLIGANKGVLPHKKAETKEEIEEERRLFYVGMTRAKNNLYISSNSEKSIFIKEILEPDEEIEDIPINKPIKPKEVDVIPIGTKVRHKKFGNGKIIGYEANNRFIVIKFKKLGEKKFLHPDTIDKKIIWII